MSQPHPLAARVRELLGARRVRERRMFGGMAFMVDEHLAVSAGNAGDLLVRVDPEDFERHLERGATPASMGPGKTMGRGWMRVPAEAIAAEAELGFWVEVGVAATR